MRKKIIIALTAVSLLVLAGSGAMAARGVMPQEEFLDYCARGKLSQVGKGVRRKADVNRMERTGLSPLICAAAEQDDPRVIEYLVKKGAEVERANFQGYTPLMFAAMYNPVVRVTKALLNAGASPERGDSFGQNALNYAARLNANPAVLEALLAGRDVNYRSAAGETPLMNAAQNRNAAVTELLLERGADVSLTDPEGRTALSFAAASNQNAEVLQALLDAGADVDHAARNGMTPLMEAARSNLNPAVAELLLERGADKKARAKNGQTAEQFAKRNSAMVKSEVYSKLR